MERPDAVLFDLDGTIVDSRVPYVRSINHALAGVGLPEREPASLHQYLGPPLHTTLTEHLEVPAGSVDRVVALYRERYAVHGLDETIAFEGLPELLRELHGQVALAVATSKIRTLAVPLLERLGLADLFDVVSGPSPDAVNESKAATIAGALEALGRPERVVMVGDRLYDVVGAREHGIPTIGVLWGSGSEDELRDAGAFALVARPEEIPPLLGLQ